MAEVEYHWILSYVAPTVGGLTVSHQSGVEAIDVETRHGAFLVVKERVANAIGVDPGDLSVLSFSLELNALPAQPEPTTLRLGAPHVKMEGDPLTIARDQPRLRPKSGMDFGGALKALKEGMKATRPCWRPGWYVVLRDGEIKAHTPDGFFTPWIGDSEDLLADDWLVASPDGDIRWPDGTVA